MKKQSLTAEKREIHGKKVRHLRKKGLLPLSLYGKNIKSQSLQTDTKSFQLLLKEAGQTGLIDVTIKNDKKAHTVLINNPQYHPVSGLLLHADLHEVPLKEKLRVKVPVEYTGTSPASDKGIGVLLRLVDELEIEALPADLPESIPVDISSLSEIGNEITVKNIQTKPTAFTIINSPETVLVRINPLEKEEVVAPPPAVEGEAAESAAEGEAVPSGKGEIPPSEQPKETPVQNQKQESPKEK